MKTRLLFLFFVLWWASTASAVNYNMVSGASVTFAGGLYSTWPGKPNYYTQYYDEVTHAVVGGPFDKSISVASGGVVPYGGTVWTNQTRVEIGYYNASNVFTVVTFQQAVANTVTPTPTSDTDDRVKKGTVAGGVYTDTNNGATYNSSTGAETGTVQKYFRNLTITNTDTKPRTYHVTETAPGGSTFSDGTTTRNVDITLQPGETQTVNIQSPFADNYTITHDTATVLSDGGGVTFSQTTDASGTLFPYYTGSALTAPPTISDNASPTTAGMSAQSASTYSSVGTGTGGATQADIGKGTDNIKNAVDRTTANALAIGDQAHKDANTIASAIKAQGSGSGSNTDLLNEAGSAGSVGSGPSGTPSVGGLGTKVSQIGTDLGNLKDALGLGSYSNSTTSLNFSWSSTLGSVSYNLDAWLSYITVLRGVLLFFLSIWFVFEVIKTVKGAFA